MRLIELDIPVDMDPNAPEIELKSDEFDLEISFNLFESDGRGVLRFTRVLQHTFGYPNIDVISGHRYYNLGLGTHLFVEIKNSEVIKEIVNSNRIHPQHMDSNFSGYRHFVLPFHDSTLEVIAESYEFI